MIRSRCQFYKNFISENNSDQKKLFSATKKLLNDTDEVPYPPFNSRSLGGGGGVKLTHPRFFLALNFAPIPIV